jgi:hypothetical protein
MVGACSGVTLKSLDFPNGGVRTSVKHVRSSSSHENQTNYPPAYCESDEELEAETVAQGT